jgi:hypothetical protein
MTEVIPVYIKGKDEVLLLEPAPANQAIQADKEAAAPPKSIAERRCQGERKNRQGDAGA